MIAQSQNSGATRVQMLRGFDTTWIRRWQYSQIRM